jgi:hypothetical protein
MGSAKEEKCPQISQKMKRNDRPRKRGLVTIGRLQKTGRDMGTKRSKRKTSATNG